MNCLATSPDARELRDLVHRRQPGPDLSTALEAIFANGGQWSGNGEHEPAHPLLQRPERRPDHAGRRARPGTSIASIQDPSHRPATRRTYGTALDAVSSQVDRGIDGATLQAVAASSPPRPGPCASAPSRWVPPDQGFGRDRRPALQRSMKSARKRTDALTSLANRKHFDDRLTDAVETGAPFCVIMGDVDHFKGFNDTWGHQTGDPGCCASSARASARTSGTRHRRPLRRRGILRSSCPETTLANAGCSPSRSARQCSRRRSSSAVPARRWARSPFRWGRHRCAPAIRRKNWSAAPFLLYTAKRSDRNMVVSDEQLTIVRGSASAARRNDSFPDRSGAPIWRTQTIPETRHGPRPSLRRRRRRRDVYAQSPQALNSLNRRR